MASEKAKAYPVWGFLAFCSLILWVLKQTGVWDISYLWVLSPLWVTVGLALIFNEAVIVYKFFRFGYWK